MGCSRVWGLQDPPLATRRPPPFPRLLGAEVQGVHRTPGRTCRRRPKMYRVEEGATAPFYKLATLPVARAAAWEMKSGAAGSRAPDAPSRRPQLHFYREAPGSRGQQRRHGPALSLTLHPLEAEMCGPTRSLARGWPSARPRTTQAGLGPQMGRPEDGCGNAGRAPGGAGPRKQGAQTWRPGWPSSGQHGADGARRGYFRNLTPASGSQDGCPHDNRR